MIFSNLFKTRLPKVSEALVGRNMPVFAGGPHAVLGTPMTKLVPACLKQIVLPALLPQHCYYSQHNSVVELE